MEEPAVHQQALLPHLHPGHRPGDDVHGPEDDDAVLVIDLGGNDTYTHGASANLLKNHPVSIVIDVAGEDRYSGENDFSFGGALGGVAIQWDCAGNDTYRGGNCSCGAGILGVGLLAIPTLAGSAAYALSETFAWRQGLNQKFRRARAFYGVIVMSTVVGVAIDFAGMNPIRVLYWSSVVNGLLAPFLLFAALAVACDRQLMRGQPSSILGRTTVFITALFMIAAGVATLVL